MCRLPLTQPDLPNPGSAPSSVTLVYSEEPMKLSSITLFSAVALTALAFGCKKSEAPKVAAPTAPVSEPVPGPAMLKGTVLETMDAANYTYVRVKTDKEEIWAATAQAKLSVGDKVTIPADMPMKDFNSPTLKRTFPTIYFTGRIYKEGEMPGTPAPH